MIEYFALSLHSNLNYKKRIMTNYKATRDNMSKGIQYVCDMLAKVKMIIEEDTSPYYDLPYYIYRGVTRFYPSDGKESTRQTPEHVVENDYIRSGVAIRMENTSTMYGIDNINIRANYICSLKEMVNYARKHYPEKYPEGCYDLDILADIQHNGGATCLVDFSKNFLTALWFACKDDPKQDGYIYCYNVMKDMVENDTLTYIRPKEEKLPIDILLSQTYRETNISSDIAARFCLWEPSPRNNRILRQDSIFLFGIEKFHVMSHGIKVLRVPAKQKQFILLAMKSLFRISSSTIFNDPVGFANNNAKFIPWRKIIENIYNRGYVNMIRGDYDSALDFFKLWESGFVNHIIPIRKELELHFSLAVCYKSINQEEDSDIHYYENAILEYKEVIRCGKQILKQARNQADIAYYKQKCTRAYNGIVDVEFYAGKYLEAISTCDEIISEINSGILKQESSNSEKEFTRKGKELDPKYCKITKMEMLDLELLTNWNQYIDIGDEWEQDFHDKMEKFHKEASEEEKLTFFDKLLIRYYKSIFDILTDNPEIKGKDVVEEFGKWIVESSKKEGKDIYRGYLLWNFMEMKSAIDSLRGYEQYDKHNKMQYLTALAISFRDKYDMQILGRSESV